MDSVQIPGQLMKKFVEAHAPVPRIAQVRPAVPECVTIPQPPVNLAVQAWQTVKVAPVRPTAKVVQAAALE